MYIFRAISARCCTTDRLPCQTHQSAIQASDCLTTLALNSDYNDIWVRQCTACHAMLSQDTATYHTLQTVL